MEQTKETQSQFEVLVDYMEKNGDLCKIPSGPQGKLENLQKWLELSNILNKAIGCPKPLEKWRKTWSDYKNNVKKKVQKIARRQGDVKTKLTDVEKRVLMLVGDDGAKPLSKLRRRGLQSDNDNNIICKEEVKSEVSQKSPPPPSYFLCVDDKASKRRRDTASSSDTSTSSESRGKRRKSSTEDNLKEITDRFLELERDREKMAHEREMARIKQNDQLISVFDRIVNVLETLAPSMQRYLDRQVKEDG